jgi:hydroxyethylthiazole kinase-like uncharacterized protein yjeF
MADASSPQLAPIYRSAELRAIEAGNKAQPLMERAGLAAAEVARTLAAERVGTVLVLAGPGNNGGDAFVVARWLRSWFYEVAVVFLQSDPAKLPADAAAAYRAFAANGDQTISAIPADWRGPLIIDGLFGIGLSRSLSADYAALVERANALSAPILALDVPTGLNGDTGVATGPAIRASATTTFIALKPGLLTGEGIDLCGALSVHTLDVDLSATAPARGHRLDWNALRMALPLPLQRRARNVHKGTFGTLAIVGGAPGMVGAPLLAGRAAMKLGTGKVRVGFSAHEHPNVDWGAPELMLRRAQQVLGTGADALVVGPGLGTDADAVQLLSRGLTEKAPLVLDADALNLIAKHSTLRETLRNRGGVTTLTPHPAEAARLLDTEIESIERDRLAAAQTLASELNAHVVLKGAGSVLAHPDGTWDINASGNPALATAGSGDILAGFVGALLAQGIDAKTALRYAVCVHGAAADLLVARGHGPLGVLASDLPDAARTLINDASRPKLDAIR